MRPKSEARDVLVYVVLLTAKRARRLQPEEVQPEVPERSLVGAPDGDLLQAEDAKRASGHALRLVVLEGKRKRLAIR